MKFLRKEDVSREFGISPRGLEKMVGEGRFPVPVRIGKRAVWSSLPVERWLVEAFAAQESWARMR